MGDRVAQLKQLFQKLWQYKYAKVLSIACLSIILFFTAGYMLILFGGNMIVDEKDLILDAASTIETTDGTVMKELYEENRKPVKIQTLPTYVPNAFIAIEDRRFREHGAVDVRSAFRAIFRDIAAGSKAEGASTITQQVVKNLILSQEKTWMRKTKEVMASVYLERHYAKDEILALYLNGVYFGEGAYGIEQAARVYFDKHARELTVDEAALLAGMVKSPAAYSPRNHPEKAQQRRDTVLTAMERAGFLSAKAELKASRQTIRVATNQKQAQPWVDSFTDVVLKEAAAKYDLPIEELKRGGYRIVTTMDEAAQRHAYQALQRTSYFPGSNGQAEGAFVLMDQQHGGLAAVVGGRNYKLGDLNRAVVKRQPGSTMKPLAVYGPAMMKGYKPYDLLEDEKKTYDGYTATNYDGQYDHSVTMYRAIMESKNASAVWLLNEIGIPYAKRYLDKMGMSLPDDGLSIALGGLQEGVTPIQLAGAYRTFIHQGDYIEPHAIKAIRDADNQPVKRKKLTKQHVFSPQASWNMVEMLKATVNKGTAKAGHYPKALAGKTGTTQHPQAAGKTKDAWFAGVTPDYALALWMGYDKSDAAHYLTGGSEYPTMLAKSILTELDKETERTAAFSKPDNVKALPEPIEMPKISKVKASIVFGGTSLVEGKITWRATPKDKRVIYRVYESKSGADALVGEVKGKTTCIIKGVGFFKTKSYYVVPYDPLTKTEGPRSEIVKL